VSIAHSLTRAVLTVKSTAHYSDGMTATTPRVAARAATMRRITDEARRQLARDGAAGLSLRSVARELGMVSSGIYRYVASRDELLTLLIVEGYDDLGAALERARRGAGDGERDRWRAVALALRTWARRRPHEYALLYGSPVPGYAAPPDTIGPATRVYSALAAAAPAPAGGRPAPDALVEDARRAGDLLGIGSGPAGVLQAFGAWMQLFGAVSFELFGHMHGVIEDLDAYYQEVVEDLADRLGL
jgi:AcrR family transcriptional regulator